MKFPEHFAALITPECREQNQRHYVMKMLIYSDVKINPSTEGKQQLTKLT